MSRVLPLVVLAAACTEPVALDATDAALARGTAFTVLEEQPIADAGRPLALYERGLGQNLAQTFTPGAPHQELGYVELPVACQAGAALNVRITDGLGGPVLYEINVIGLPEVQAGAFQLIQVYDPAVGPLVLSHRRTYAVELAAFGGTCSIAAGPAGDSYDGGQGWYADTSWSGTWYPLPSGAIADDEDLPFRVLTR